jgi:type I restriction enzyme M protein
MATPEIITCPDGKIVDYIDGKYRNDTPEEYVRQTVEKRLILEHKYKQENIRIEYTVKLASSKKRADIVIFPEGTTEFTQENIYIIIECKNEKVTQNDRKDGVEQLKSYMAACPNCEWGMWTNGRSKAVFRKVLSDGKYHYEEPNDIISADGSIEDIDRPKRQKLKRAADDNLLFVFRTCHNYIYVNDGFQKQPAFFEFLKIIFCKIEDERNVPAQLEFYATSNEKSNPDGQLTVQNRIGKIFSRVKKKYGKIFEPNDEIKLSPRSLAYVVSELQKYYLLDTHVDIKGKAYEELVGSNLRGDRGEFFTPRNVMKMAVEMIAPKAHEKVLDPACGTGGFLVMAMNYVIEQLKEEITKSLGKHPSEWSDTERNVLREKIKSVAEENFFGFDINPDLVKATKMNMVMNNDGSGNILRTDSLLPPHEWDDDFKTQLSKKLSIDKKSITNYKNIEFFDVIITNPPFGSKLPIKDESILSQFNIGYIWENKQKKVDPTAWAITKKTQSSVPPEQLFIERCWQFLKPGGRFAIVLPDAILGSPGLGYIRKWLLENTHVIASIDLHVDTFQPKNGTQTSILILQKKTEEEKNKELKEGTIPDRNIFMAMVEKVGHDKRGNTLFKRDKEGNEIYLPEDDEGNPVFGQIADGTPIEQPPRRKKIHDDQTVLVPEIFAEWKIQEGISW